MDINKQAELIVNEIITNMSDRKGLGDQWDSIDEDIQNEIKQEWKDIVKNILA